MNTFVALFRGINVGGHNKLLMRELVKLLQELGLQNIQTYIQSGNVVFESREDSLSILSDRIRTAIQHTHGFSPAVFLLSAAEFERAIVANPYPEAKNEPKSLHLFFLEAEPLNADLGILEEVKRENERYSLKGRVFYLHAPDGIGRSKLAERIGKALGVTVTARNWRTVEKLLAMAKK